MSLFSGAFFGCLSGVDGGVDRGFLRLARGVDRGLLRLARRSRASLGRVRDSRVLVEAVGHKRTHAAHAIGGFFAHEAANLGGRPPSSDALGKHVCDLTGTSAVHGLHPLGQARPDERACLVDVVMLLSDGLGGNLLALLGYFRRSRRCGMLGCPRQGLGELASVPPAFHQQARGILS